MLKKPMSKLRAGAISKISVLSMAYGVAFFLTCSVGAHANSTDIPHPAVDSGHDPASSKQTMQIFRKSAQDIVEGHDVERVQRNKTCSMVAAQGYMIRQELGKLEYDHLFHEIQGDSHRKDILELEQSLVERDNCKKNAQLWLAYDDKWYAPRRDQEIAARKKQEDVLLASLTDTGEDIWDGVINGQVLAVPRKYMWAGRNRKDGVADGLNIRLPFETKDGKKISIMIVLEPGFVSKAPCYGFDTKQCVFQSANVGFQVRYLNCSSSSENGKRIYKALWQKNVRCEKRVITIRPRCSQCLIKTSKCGALGRQVITKVSLNSPTIF